MLRHKQADKARHYIDRLDAARCDERWHEIPELTRKVEKHAPHRHCLIVTARTERVVVEHVSTQKEVMLLPKYTSPVAGSLFQCIHPLVKARKHEVNFKEDAFQAQICLAWLYMAAQQRAEALSHVPDNMEQAFERLIGEAGVIGRWTHVCIIRGVYIRGSLLEIEGKTKEELRTYESMSAYLSHPNLPSVAEMAQHYELRKMVLARWSMMLSRYISQYVNPIDLLSSTAPIPPDSLLWPFRTYAWNWDESLATRGGRPRFTLQPWQAYYDSLSIFLQRGLCQPMFSTKMQQSKEIKLIETIYEEALLGTVTFPRADQTSSQVESFIDQVMANWRKMCGWTWEEEELPEGGKAALSQTVLDILYRAAARTFHSTRVLRHLFTVHTARAEFPIASKALLTYLHIVAKGKARVEKSGQAEAGLDNDVTAVSTAAAGINVLCNYGRRDGAEKSLEVSKILDTWAKSIPPVNDGSTRSEEAGKTLALAYHALGTSQARWARLTYETSSRSDLRSNAVANFQKALSSEFDARRSLEHLEILYSLAFVLAESRHLDGAITHVKDALGFDPTEQATHGAFKRKLPFGSEEIPDPPERFVLMKSWHLLALLMSATGNFSKAIASCEAALDLYGGKSILSGDTKPLGSLQGLLLSEKRAIIQIKMTQLALLEVIESPEQAVNASGELLGLYRELFKHEDRPAPTVQEPSTSAPPTATGIFRSIRGKIMGLPKVQGFRFRKTEPSGQTSTTTTGSLPRDDSSPIDSTRPPTISITGDDGAVPENPSQHSHLLGRHVSKKLHKRNSQRPASRPVSSYQLSRNPSPTRPATSDGTRRRLSLDLPHRNRNAEPSAVDRTGSMKTPNTNKCSSDEVGLAISHDLPSIPASPTAVKQSNPLHSIPSTKHNMNHRNPNKHPVVPQPPPFPKTYVAEMFLPCPPAPILGPYYSPEDERRHALSLLTEIWLQIASLYRKASMPVDAQGALSEATKHVRSVETDIVALHGSSAESFSTPGYSGLKSSDELWADVQAEQAALHSHLKKTDLASKAYESALVHCPDHVAATIGLSNILLDEWEAPPPPKRAPNRSTLHLTPIAPTPTLGSLPSASSVRKSIFKLPFDVLIPRLEARDRAYGLLSALTKSGKGWDSNEAWFALGRAYEASDQLDKATEAYLWVVQLDERRPIRGWECIG